MRKAEQEEDADEATLPISVGVEKLHLLHVERDISALYNRLSLLKEQKRRDELLIFNNKQHLKAAVYKKQEIDLIHQHKVRDNSYDVYRVKQQAQLNRQKKQQHKQMMEDLTMASYLVKAEEAQIVKNMTIEHEEAVKNIRSSVQQTKRLRHDSLKSSYEHGRQEYRHYWNYRVKEAMVQNYKIAQEILTERQQKQRYLKELEKEEIRMLKDIYRTHEQTIDTKKDFLTALSVPAGEVAELYKKEKPAPKPMPAPVVPDSKIAEYHEKLKLPKAVLHYDKLRKVIQSLRQMRTQGRSLSPN